MTRVRGRVWRDGELVASDFPLADLDAHLADPTTLTWLDLDDPAEEVLAQLAGELGLDKHAVEDAVAPRERPKATRHASHTFLTCYAASLVEGAEGLPTMAIGRISAFVMPRGLITIRVSRGTAVDLDQVIERWEGSGLLGYGVGALVHGLLDVLVDGHFEAVQAMDDRLEELEDLLFSDTVRTREVQVRVFALRKALVSLRRVVLPMREVVAGVMRQRLAGDWEQSRELDGEFADLYDHVLRAAEWSESLRDMVSSVFETNLSLQDARLNTIMKKLASWGAIIAVPTAVTGWFGQNLPYWGFSSSGGLWQSVVLIVVGTIGLYWLFRRNDWL
ncbi:MAG: magnesium transporter CorA family protein [Micropruina sp.]|uniref:magnesium transporter CorA family protein n=1 Tax=Micropruina sp. TaxID=2737536 RepID=UPI0039E2446C